MRYLIPIYVSIAVVLVTTSTALAGFGVSPGTISEDKLVPGSVIDKTIYLVQGNNPSDIEVNISVEPEEMSEWVTIVTGNTQIIPGAVQQFPVQIKIAVPSDADLGSYKGFILITTNPSKVEGSDITIALGGKINLDLTVGDDVVADFNVKSIEILDVKEGQDPKAKVSIQNIGNVPIAPDGATFELFNKYGDLRLSYGESDEFVKAPPFSEQDSILTFPLPVRLAEGEYWGHVKIYRDSKVVKEQRTVFNVQKQSFFIKNSIPIASGVAIFFVAIILFKIIRRKRTS